MRTGILIIGAAIGVIIGALTGCSTGSDGKRRLDPKTIKVLKRTAINISADFVRREIEELVRQANEEK